MCSAVCTLYTWHNLDNNRSRRPGGSFFSMEKFWEIFTHKLIVFIFCLTVCHGIWHDKKLLKICYHRKQFKFLSNNLPNNFIRRFSHLTWFSWCLRVHISSSLPESVCVQKQCGSCDWNDGSFVVILSPLPKFVYVGSSHTHPIEKIVAKKTNKQWMNE